ncbi:MAG TPA: C40 family peptidase, partial [Gemmatimonadaceae bacterium]
MIFTRIRRTVAVGALALIGTQALDAQKATPVPPSVRVSGVVDGSTVVETARRYLGVRYLLGGTTPRAFDCSGFIRYVFALHGLSLPRTAHEQAALGIAPDQGKLEPGDLLFFYGGR